MCFNYKIFNFQRRAAYQLYIIEVLGIIAQEAGITDEKLSDRTFLIANDVLNIEKSLAEV